MNTDIPSSNSQRAVIILAAGKGKRMNNPEKAKVMFELNNTPMIGYVVATALRLFPQQIIIVVGWQKDSIIEYVSAQWREEVLQQKIIFAEQREQLGTGHAVMQAEQTLRLFNGNILVLSGDVPMLAEKTLRKMFAMHSEKNAIATILTAIVENPTGYGRIVRNENGSVQNIVEEKDATAEGKKITEINSGIYIFDHHRLFSALQHITPDNAQKEYYLTDVFNYFWRNALPVVAQKSENVHEVLGINTVSDLEQLQSVFFK